MKKYKNMDIITIIAVIMLSLGGIFASIVTWNFRKQTIRYQDEIHKISNQTMELSRQIKGAITGEESYVYTSVSGSSYSGGEMEYRMIIQHQGNFPVRNLKITIEDLVAFNKKVKENEKVGKKVKSSDVLKSCTYTIDFGDIYPKRQYFIDKEISDILYNKDRKHVHYKVKSEAENFTTYEQWIIIDWNQHRIDAKYLKKDSGEILWENIDERFPRTKEGKPRWMNPEKLYQELMKKGILR